MFSYRFSEIWRCEYPYFTVPLWFPATGFVIFVTKFLAVDARHRLREHPPSRSISSGFIFNDRSTQLFPWILRPNTQNDDSGYCNKHSQKYFILLKTKKAGTWHIFLTWEMFYLITANSQHRHILLKQKNINEGKLTMTNLCRMIVVILSKMADKHPSVQRPDTSTEWSIEAIGTGES